MPYRKNVSAWLLPPCRYGVCDKLVLLWNSKGSEETRKKRLSVLGEAKHRKNPTDQRKRYCRNKVDQ